MAHENEKVFNLTIIRNTQFKIYDHIIIHSSLIRRAKSKIDSTLCGGGLEERVLACVAGGDVDWYSHCGGHFGHICQPELEMHILLVRSFTSTNSAY